jgi:hypothetical protein
MSCRLQETGILPIAYWTLADGEGTYPYPVHRLLILLTGSAPHQKKSFRDVYQLRCEHWGQVLLTKC